MKVASVNEMQNMDRRAIEKFGICDDLLMENAGLSVYSVILNQFGIEGRTFAVICGSGNNGGDGLVVARKIHSMGGIPRVFLMGSSDNFRGAAKKNFKIVKKLPIEIKSVDSSRVVKKGIEECDCVVDAIFGTGLAREVGGVYREVIELINRSGKTIFSVDIPSGINGDTGEVMGSAVNANYTVTFGLPKIGNLLYPGYNHCGRLYVCHISFPYDLYSNDSLKVEINTPCVLPDRKEDGHKGSFGDVLFIAGASYYFGAPYFSALSFLRAGGGYSRLAAPQEVISAVASGGSEIVFVPQRTTGSGSIALDNKEDLLNLSHNVDMVVIGPGLSLDEETQLLVRELVKNIEKPVLIDGDGITAISKEMSCIEKRKYTTVLTPHPGEMSRISGKSISEIARDRIKIVRNMSHKYNAIIVLKGAHSLIGYPDGSIYINLSGNSGMASAGSGDVLTGTIAAMYGIGLSLEEAVRTGVFMHGFAGDIAAADKGEDGITARDILECLPGAVKSYRKNYSDIIFNCYNKIELI